MPRDILEEGTGKSEFSYFQFYVVITFYNCSHTGASKRLISVRIRYSLKYKMMTKNKEIVASYIFVFPRYIFSRNGRIG
jgi:hypothetical protein